MVSCKKDTSSIQASASNCIYAADYSLVCRYNGVTYKNSCKKECPVLKPNQKQENTTSKYQLSIFSLAL